VLTTTPALGAGGPAFRMRPAFAFARSRLRASAVWCWSADVRAHEHSFVRALGRLVKYHKPPALGAAFDSWRVPRPPACPSAQPLWVSGAIAARTG
jgi:hypothetical protein